MTYQRSLTTVLVLVATLLAAAGWRAHMTDPSVHVVVITLDTTRADRLSPYGFMDASMPALERIAAEGVVFDRAFTVAPLTLPAHTSLFTGLLPPHHRVRDNAAPPLEERYKTLAEVLRSEGYCTAAFVSSVVLAANRGLAQGFSYYGGVNAALAPQRRADDVVDEAMRWLNQDRPCPLFLWAHLYDGHRPYEPPEPYRSRFTDPYVGELAFAESQVQRLLDALERRRLLEDTLLIVTADHGESLGEHGEENHGMFLYESVVRIPLLIRLPRGLRTQGTTGTRVAAVVRLNDVMPTVLDVAGIQAPLTDGVSLFERMNGDNFDLEDLEAYAESTYPLRFGEEARRALRDSRFKLIDSACPELYDLAADPFEQRNLHDDKRTVAEALMRTLQQIGSQADARDAALPPPSHDLLERLGALGYVHGSSGRGHDSRYRLISENGKNSEKTFEPQGDDTLSARATQTGCRTPRGGVIDTPQGAPNVETHFRHRRRDVDDVRSLCACRTSSRR